MTAPVGGCPFCDIATGVRPASKVLDDERVVAFLDRHPINAGHVLVVPRVHAPSFYDLAEEDFVPVMLAARRLALALDGIYRPRKVGMLAAGLDVAHVHIHVLPMHDYHDITSRVIPGFSFSIGNDDFDRPGRPGRPDRRDRVCFYEHFNYEGDRFCVRPGDRLRSLGDWNDRISSIRVIGDAEAQVCEHNNFRGRCIVVDESRRRLGGANDQISSVRVR